MRQPEPVLKTSWPQVLAWRMGQHWLDPLGDGTAVDVVRRLCGAQAQVQSAATTAVAVRQKRPDPGEVARDLAERRLMRTWAMRGTLHLLTPDEAGAFLSLTAAARTWEKGSWQRAFGVKPEEMVELVAAVGEILTDRVLSRDELVTEIGERLNRPDMEEELRSGWGTILKPIAWQGMLCHGPSQGSRVTFTRPQTWLPGWAGVPEPEAAAHTAIPAYLRAYGPASPETFDAWLTRGLSKKAQLRGWFASLADQLVTVEVDGEPLYLLAEDVDALATTSPSATIRLLPAFDPYVLGPGTSAAHIVPTERRSEVSRTGGWISPVVLAGGRVVGVWELVDDAAVVRPFDEHPGLDFTQLASEIERLGNLSRRAAEA